MTYYAPKPPPERRDRQPGNWHERPGLDASGCMEPWGCEAAACLGWLACGWPCSLSIAAAVLLAALALLLS